MSLDSIEYIESKNINGCNLYAYCMNDPVNKADPNGNAWHVVIGAAVGAATSLFWQMVIEKKKINELDLVDVCSSAIAGAVSVAVPASGFSTLLKQSVISTTLTTFFEWFATGEEVDPLDVLYDFGSNMVFGYISGKISDAIDSVGKKIINKLPNYSQLQNHLRKKGLDWSREVVTKKLHKLVKNVSRSVEVSKKVCNGIADFILGNINNGIDYLVQYLFN